MEPGLSSSLREPHHFSPNLGFRTANPLLFQASKRSSLRTLKLGFLRTNSSISSSTTQQDKDSVSSVNPVYVPTPQNRDLRTPHSGYVCICWALISKSSDFFLLYFDLSVIRYHFDGTSRKFFEGWYFKVSIPERRQSFCFMYSVENPAFRKKLTPLEVAQNGSRSTGVGAQILGAYDKYICQYSEESQNFWGSKNFFLLDAI